MGTHGPPLTPSLSTSTLPTRSFNAGLTLQATCQPVRICHFTCSGTLSFLHYLPTYLPTYTILLWSTSYSILLSTSLLEDSPFRSRSLPASPSGPFRGPSSYLFYLATVHYLLSCISY